MKKILALILALVMVFALAGCSGVDAETIAKLDDIQAHLDAIEAQLAADEAPAEEAGEADVSEPEEVAEAVSTVWREKLDAGEEVLIYVIAPAYDNESTINITDTLTETVEAIGCTVNAVSAEFDNANVISAIENAITQEAAAVCIFPMDAALLEDVVARAREAGTMIFFFGEKPAYEIDGGIISDNTLTGEAVAQMAFSWLNEKYPDAEPGSIGVFVGGCKSNEMNSEYQIALEAAVEANELCYISYLNTSVDSLTIDGGFSMAEDALTADPNIKLFLCQKPDVAIGINNYLESRADLDFTGFGIFSSDANQGVAELVFASENDGSAVRGLIPFGTENVGYDLGEILVDIINGEKEPPYWGALQIDTLNMFGWTYEEG